MGHILMLLGLLLYVYGVLGFYLFREHDPEHWGALGAALLTLEGWVEIQAAVLGEIPFAWMYFASFVFVAVFVVVNLFIAVVLNNLESAKIEIQAGEDRQNPHRAVLQAIEETRARLAELERHLRERPSPGAPHPTLSPEGRGRLGFRVGDEEGAELDRLEAVREARRASRRPGSSARGSSARGRSAGRARLR